MIAGVAFRLAYLMIVQVLSWLALLASNPAALARPARRPPLDLSPPIARPNTHRTADPGPRAADGPRESSLGLQTHPGQAGRTRPSRGRLDRLEDPQRRRT